MWVIDRTGGFREVRLQRMHRGWATGLRWLWDFTRAECEILPARHLPATELFDNLGDLKSRPPFQIAGHLRGFLKRLPPDRVFNETLFRSFWEQFAYQLEAKEWEEHYP
jgi:hypothetical protein